MPEKTVNRVTRLLALLGYLADHDDVAVSELAAHFGVTEAQILKDIDLLWVTGTPGYYPDDLIDFMWDHTGSRLSLREGRGFDRKIRLAPREALALATAVQWMTVSGKGAPALESLAAKLAAVVPAVVETADAPPAHDLLARAIANQSAVVIEYVSAEDEVTHRVILPEILSTDGVAWYTEAWCALAGARRTFRLDRILSLRDADDAEAALAGDTRNASPADSHELRKVTFTVDPQNRYIAEDLPDAKITASRDQISVQLDVGRTDWLVRLALGGGIRSIDQEVADEIRSRSAAALEAYREYDADRIERASTGSEYP